MNYEPYYSEGWKNNEEGGTPITAASLNHVDDGLLDHDEDLQNIFGDMATIEEDETASQSYAIGDYLILDGLLYKVTTAISSGGTIAPGTNCEQTTVSDELNELNSKKTNNYVDATYSAVGMDEGNNQYIDIHARSANNSYTLYAAASGIYLWDGNARQSIQRMYWDPIDATLPTNTNLNNVTSPGSYRLLSTNTYTNTPYTNAYGIFEVVNNYTGVRLQRLTNDSGVWYRYYKSDGTWTVWKKYFTAPQSSDGTLIKVLDITVTGDVPANSSKTITSGTISVPSGYGLISVFPRFTSSTLTGIIGCYLTENSTKVSMAIRNFTSSAATGITAHAGVLLCKSYG